MTSSAKWFNDFKAEFLLQLLILMKAYIFLFICYCW